MSFIHAPVISKRVPPQSFLLDTFKLIVFSALMFFPQYFLNKKSEFLLKNHFTKKMAFWASSMMLSEAVTAFCITSLFFNVRKRQFGNKPDAQWLVKERDS